MTYTAETPRTFLDDLERVAQIRRRIAEQLDQIAETITQAEVDAEDGSGKLNLEREITDIRSASENLNHGVFRLLVLGDMKRGKSTFLNALIGENLLPSDVNPCTALLTILRYGPEKRVRVHFNDGKPPEETDFKRFKREYTIDPEEAKALEQKKQLAFPDVSHGIVDYPLPILQKGVEIVDSPGLNDTEARNDLSLGYIHNCHAILFVLRASQPCTLAERRYLENYIKDRGLTVFFLINAWDQVKEALIDPDDQEELEEAETRLRKVFHANLAEYCQVDGHDLYDERVFEISALKALRQRVKDPDADLAGTGFPPFLGALNTFLTQERAVAEMRQARILARGVSRRVQDSVERRIPLLEQDMQEFQQRVDSVAPEFEQLTQIRDEFRDEIRSMRDREARAVADSLRSYLFGLEKTFEIDFLAYQPDLNLFDFLSQSKREEFKTALEQGFQQYINDKFFAWTKQAERELDKAFRRLADSAAQYGSSYNRITEQITEKLTGVPIGVQSHTDVGEDSPGWASWAMGLISLASANPAGVAMAALGFDWKNIVMNFLTASSVAVIGGVLLGPAIAPILFVLSGFGMGMMQADQGRKELVKTLKKELIKHLPQVAQEQWQSIYSAVQECFDAYEREVMKRMNDDINARKQELDSLLSQKQTREINKETEIRRLQNMQETITKATQTVEEAYRSLLV